MCFGIIYSLITVSAICHGWTVSTVQAQMDNKHTARISNLLQTDANIAQMNDKHTDSHAYTHLHTDPVMMFQFLLHWAWNTINSRKERQFQASAMKTLVCISVSFSFSVDGEVKSSVCARPHACVSHFCWPTPSTVPLSITQSDHLLETHVSIAVYFTGVIFATDSYCGFGMALAWAEGMSSWVLSLGHNHIISCLFRFSFTL